ncbi:MAG: archease [candidate division WOR-3 bacterium]
MLSNKNYEVIEHTADLGIKVKGNSLPILFKNAILATSELLSGKIKVNPIIEKNLTIKEKNRRTALVSILQEIIFLFESELFLSTECSVNIKKHTYKIKLKGENISPSQIESGTEIKAVTYHQLEIKKIKNRYEATIIFDI